MTSMKRMAALLPAAVAVAACSGGGGEELAVEATAAPLAPVAAPAPDARTTIQAIGDVTVAEIGIVRSTVRDPGPRGGLAGAGQPLAGLGTTELSAFGLGREDFNEAEEVDEGLGPTMNLDSCGGCHLHPAVGGSSPPTNPQVAFAAKASATNLLPPFITLKGPVREARFVRNADGSPDGGVHSLFTIAGRSDAAGCAARQPDFAAALANRNVVFRIPTPVFGAGLIEQIPDREIVANMGRDVTAKRNLGIRGRGNVELAFRAITGQANRNGNDGTFGRFGWKAQNKSLLVFSGEAYNVEMGITNDLFPTERDESASCQYSAQPNSGTDLGHGLTYEGISSIEKFTVFMRLLAPPQPSPDQPGGAASIGAGKALFGSVGCALCHTPTMRTGNAALPSLRQQAANLYSDLLLHDMGAALADGITQGQAGPREFRTAPLWGLGQRLFFLHDGRTSDLRQVIAAHRSDGSEANGVIDRFSRLSDREQQDLVNFLRSL